MLEANVTSEELHARRASDSRLIRRLADEYAGLLQRETVARVVAASRHAVTFFGSEPAPESGADGLVERLARDHLTARSAALARRRLTRT